MSITPDGIDPTCEYCKGSGQVRAPWASAAGDDAFIERVPCVRCMRLRDERDAEARHKAEIEAIPPDDRDLVISLYEVFRRERHDNRRNEMVALAAVVADLRRRGSSLPGDIGDEVVQ